MTRPPAPRLVCTQGRKGGSLILPLVAFLLHTAQAPAVSQAGGKPVRVWLASSGPLLRGQPVRVYVQTTADGYLVVLHRRTDGRIEVLFPGNPTDDHYVRPGTYEIRNAQDRESFVVAEPDGTGLILAALSPGSYRFDEFVRAASWDPDALAPSWSGADAEGALADIVQRMLGDGYFNYDIVTYTVVPRPAPLGPFALQDTTAPPPYPMYSSCLGCTFVGFQEIVFEPFSLCDAFFGPCVGPRFPRHDRFSDSGIRSVDVPMNVMALSLGSTGSRSTAGILPLPLPQGRRFAFKPRTVSGSPIPPPIVPRTRVPPRAMPLGPGHMTAAGRPPRARSPAPVAFREVRIMLSPTAPTEQPPPPAPPSRGGGGGSGGGAGGSVGGAALVAVSRQAAVPAAGRPLAAAALPRSPAVAAAPAPSRGVASSGAPATAEMHGVALPRAAWHAMASRGAALSVPARRR